MPRTPLLHPDAYFESRTDFSVGTAVGIALLVALATTTGFGFVGWAVTQQLDVMVTVDNPNHTPDWVCEQQGEVFTDMPTPEGCSDDVPETKQVNLGRQVWERLVGYLPAVFLTSLVGWVVVAACLHALSAAFDASGSFGRTLFVAAWGGVPLVFQVAGGGVYAAMRLRSMTFGNDPQVAVQQLQSLAAGSSGLVVTLLSLVVVAWQVVIWGYGLRDARDVDLGGGFVAAGAVGFVVFLLGLAS